MFITPYPGKMTSRACSEVRTEYGDVLGRGRDVLHDDEHEDGDGEEEGDGQPNLLAALRWQAEDEDADDEQEDAGEEQMEDVESRPARDLDGEGDLRSGARAAGVRFLVTDAHRAVEHPLAVRQHVLDVD